ncbi:MAG: lytic transglycosylase domain-containing protein, partial [Candidatus Dormibacteria bacterium]
MYDYGSDIAAATRAYPNLSAEDILPLMAEESQGNPNAVGRDAHGSPTAFGPMQMTPATFASESPHGNIHNDRDNIMAAAKYLSSLKSRYGGDMNLAIAAYNAGPGAVDAHHGVPPFPETENEVSRYNLFRHVISKGMKPSSQYGAGQPDHSRVPAQHEPFEKMVQRVGIGTQSPVALNALREVWNKGVVPGAHTIAKPAFFVGNILDLDYMAFNALMEDWANGGVNQNQGVLDLYNHVKAAFHDPTDAMNIMQSMEDKYGAGSHQIVEAMGSLSDENLRAMAGNIPGAYAALTLYR